MKTITELIKDGKAVMLYITNPWCVSCKSLRPKVEEMVSDRFPLMEYRYIDASENPELTAELNVYSAPTILVMFEGKEYIREGKFVSINELADKIDRIYKMIFE